MSQLKRLFRPLKHLAPERLEKIWWSSLVIALASSLAAAHTFSFFFFFLFFLYLLFLLFLLSEGVPSLDSFSLVFRVSGS